MTRTEWAKNEVKLACEETRNGSVENGAADCDCACYESAMKAFQSLMNDGHSGGSIALTKSILNRLIDGLPLTAIEDTDDIWVKMYDTRDAHGDVTAYQCKRMTSLFKFVYIDGHVKYRDVSRVVCTDSLYTPSKIYSCNFIDDIIDEMFPITMPYMPQGKYTVRIEEFLLDENNGDFDTICIDVLRAPDNKLTYIHRYFKEVDHKWVEIFRDEYIKRRDEYFSV